MFGVSIFDNHIVCNHYHPRESSKQIHDILQFPWQRTIIPIDVANILTSRSSI